MTYYFLGFAYVNAGKYGDAQREWKHFLTLSGPGEEASEIKNRVQQWLPRFLSFVSIAQKIEFEHNLFSARLTFYKSYFSAKL